MLPFDLLGIVLALIYILLPLFLLRAHRRIRALEGRASALEATVRRLRAEPDAHAPRHEGEARPAQAPSAAPRDEPAALAAAEVAAAPSAATTTRDDTTTRWREQVAAPHAGADPWAATAEKGWHVEDSEIWR